MPFNGSGSYSLSDTIAPATSADANELQAILTDIGTALNTAFCNDGQSTLTGALKGADGTVSAPGYTFSADTNTGFYRVGADNPAITAGGTRIVNVTTAGVTIAGTFGMSGGMIASSSMAVLGTLGVSGAMIASSSISCLSDMGVAGFLTLSSTDGMLMAKGTTANRSTTTEGTTRYNTTLHGLEFRNASAWIVLGQAPTVQKFTSGSSATYTPATGVARIRVRMCGGGGGGGSTANPGSVGGDTSFGSWTAIHGNGGGAGNGSSGGAGGTGGVDGTGTLIVRINGGGGSEGFTSGSAGISNYSGPGGGNAFGGATFHTNAVAANTGGGGPGGAGLNAVGAGGGAGEYVEFWVTNPSATTYTVGAGGAGGTGGSVGTAGAAGIIIIEEFYA